MPSLKLFTSGEVARTVKLPRWQLLYLIERGRVPGPTFEVPGRKLFTKEDVERIRRSLTTRGPSPSLTTAVNE